MEYIWSGIITIVCVVIEIKYFRKVWKCTDCYRDIFPDSADRLEFDKERLVIESGHSSAYFMNIVKTLNKYLGENADHISDYHLMQDVVDRNRAVSESEIETLIPFTQYIGLVGTMVGILFGVCKLVWGEGLENLMSGSVSALAESGVPQLLGGVGIAVLTSAVGLGLTMCSSWRFKEAKRIVELRENAFLSWIQSEMLPNLSTDMTTALTEMTRNLSEFNKTFSRNTEKLDLTLAKVNNSYAEQVRLLDSLQRVDVYKIATANIQVYEKLKGCTDEISMIGDALQSSRRYLQQVAELTEKLDDMDERTRTWEKMGKFFEQEIKEIEKRKAAISEAVGKVDVKLKESFRQLGTTAKEQSDKIAEKMATENTRLDEVMRQQEELLNRRLGEMSGAIEQRNKRLTEVFAALEGMTKTLPAEMQRYTRELSNLADIKRGIGSLERAVREGSQKPVVTESGVVLPAAGTKMHWTLKLAIYVIALCCVALVAKEMYPMVAGLLTK